MKRRFTFMAAVALLLGCGAIAQTPAPGAPAPAKPAPVPANAAQAPSPTAGKPDPWASLRFLVGAWEAKTTGGVAQAQVSGGYAFRLELRDHVLARHSRGNGCKAPDDFDCQHGDLLYIYPAATGQGFQAIYFDNEGHVLRYDLSTPKVNSVVLVTDPAQPGPQYRLSYELVDGVMSGKFELKLPGQPDFTSYLEWSGKRE
jgi:hypothetical protein